MCLRRRHGCSGIASMRKVLRRQISIPTSDRSPTHCSARRGQLAFICESLRLIARRDVKHTSWRKAEARRTRLRPTIHTDEHSTSSLTMATARTRAPRGTGSHFADGSRVIRRRSVNHSGYSANRVGRGIGRISRCHLQQSDSEAFRKRSLALARALRQARRFRATLHHGCLGAIEAGRCGPGGAGGRSI